MPTSFNHVAIPSLDAEATARFLADLLHVPIERDGANDELHCLCLAKGVEILIQQAEAAHPHQMAFQVAPDEFAGVVARLRSAGLAFGNDPEAPTNG